MRRCGHRVCSARCASNVKPPAPIPALPGAAPTVLVMSDDCLDDWFVREILVHEERLVGYLLRRWPNRADVDDLRQDIYVRIYEAAARCRPPVPRAFLFTTAAHLLADRMRRRRVVAIDAVGDIEALDV